MENKKQLSSEEVSEVLNVYKTQAGRQSLAYTAVCRSHTSDPEHVELALRNYEASGESLESLMKNVAISSERLKKAENNREKNLRRYKAAEEACHKFVDERKFNDLKTLSGLLDNGYNLDSESAQKAEDKGDYEAAFLIYYYLPSKDSLCKKVFPIFHGVDMKSRVETNVSRFAFRNKKDGVVKFAKKRFDEFAKIYDLLCPEHRAHNENLIPTYSSIGDYDQILSRAEINPGSLYYLGRLADSGEDVPTPVLKRAIKLLESSLSIRDDGIEENNRNTIELIRRLEKCIK